MAYIYRNNINLYSLNIYIYYLYIFKSFLFIYISLVSDCILDPPLRWPLFLRVSQIFLPHNLQTHSLFSFSQMALLSFIWSNWRTIYWHQTFIIVIFLLLELCTFSNILCHLTVQSNIPFWLSLREICFCFH